MHFLSLAFAGLTTLAAASPLEARMPYEWHVKKFLDTRGSNSYDYSFHVSGPKSHSIPAFSATCAGKTPGEFVACVLESHTGQRPEVKSHVKNVVDPNDPNDTVPQVFVVLGWGERDGCNYTLSGNHIAAENAAGTGPASHFKILPGEETKAC